jgi:hypothetical protein
VIDFTTDEVGGSLGDDCVAVDAVSEEGCEEDAGTNHRGLEVVNLILVSGRAWSRVTVVECDNASA